ncbi:MAG: hypothetical protein A4E43_01380 [Methanosaeta sp. PtaB.Bin005]|nr:MAG: hypothetical protein A4E43_01380 [Methanosaeta sp. PtaB.Bin005]
MPAKRTTLLSRAENIIISRSGRASSPRLMEKACPNVCCQGILRPFMLSTSRGILSQISSPPPAEIRPP